MNDLFVDIVLLSDMEKAAPLCISAVYFDMSTGAFGEEIFVKIDPESCRSVGLDVYSEDLRYWMGKQRYGIDLLSEENRTSLRLAIHLLSGFAFFTPEANVISREGGLNVWGCNLPTILDCFAAMKAKSLWDRSRFRDFPTLVQVGERAGLKWTEKEEMHPLDVAKEKARYTVRLFNSIRPILKLV